MHGDDVYFPLEVTTLLLAICIFYSVCTASHQTGHNNAHLLENYKPEERDASAGTMSLQSDATVNHPILANFTVLQCVSIVKCASLLWSEKPLGCPLTGAINRQC